MVKPLPDEVSDRHYPSDVLSAMETAVWRTVTYADLFDYPLTAVEIHRYLEETAATVAEVETVLANGRLQPGFLARVGDYYALAGREKTAATREARARTAEQLWPAALYYGRLMASLPFARMVAVTGSLSMNNVDEGADIDYLIVARNGRVWLNRAFAITIVRLAARQGYSLCPNYILAERALNFPDQNLYTAHEITQMIPLSGFDIYAHVRRLNSWADTFLPNAAGPPPHPLDGRAADPAVGRTPHHRLRQLAEIPLRTPLGHWLEQWEMARKIRKFQRHQVNSEVTFSADWCKGHFDAHKSHVLTAYQTRLNGEQ